MKKTTIFIVLLFGLLQTYGQSPDSTIIVASDFKGIVLTYVSDSSSIYYYPKLLEKVKDDKLALTPEDGFYLYYGQIFKEGHKGLPFLSSEKYQEFYKAANLGRRKKTIKLGVEILEEDPANLFVLLHTCKSMDEKKDERFPAYDNLLRCVVMGILSTGDGKTPATAIKITEIGDDYVLKGFIGYFGGEEQLYSENGKAYNMWVNNGAKLYFEYVFNLEIPKP